MDKESNGKADQRQNNQNQDREMVDARVLGQILAAQNVLFALPDITHITEFYAQSLISIPGISACRVCLGNKSVQAGEMKSKACGECKILREMEERENDFFPADANFECDLADQPDTRIIPIRSYQHHFGFFVAEIENAAVFEAYHPFILNLSNHVALILENRLQRDWLQKAHDELERRVEDRTQDLVSANASLQEEIEIRRQAENALRESEERFRSFVEKANDIVYTVSLDGVFTYVSPNWKEMLGHETSEVEGRSFEIFVHPDDLAICRAILNRAIVSGEKQSGFEYRVKHKDGSWQWHTSNASVIRDVNGGIISFLGIARNITERKNTEAQLLASEQLFRALVENSPDFIARYDREFRRIYINPAIQKLFGVPTENVLGKTPASESPVYAPQAYIDHLRQVIETATEGSLEMPFRTAQGEMHWGHMRFVPEVGPDGKVISVLAIGRDIHEIKENERRFRMLAENFPDFVIRFDRDGRYTYVNPAFEKAFGMSAESIIGKTLQELPQLGKTGQNVASLVLIRRAFDEGVANESEARWNTEMGERIFENRYVPEKDAAGNVATVLCIARDVTERRRAEEEIRNLNQELEKRVEARTAQLEAANKELEAFAYSVSHDLRAPLRHIDGFIGMLQQRVKMTLDDQSQHYMDVIADSARKMGMLIDDLLSFSRMGRNEMVRLRVDLNELVQEIVRDFRPETEGRNIQWEIAPLPIVNGDRAMLRIVMNNLVANALKFTRPRETAQIEIGCGENNEGETVIFVRDNGVGFDMNYADKLFGVFQRLHRQEEFEGTGIGLANVHRVISRHGGRTWAEGEVGRGATFYFSLPQSKMEA